MLMGPSWSVLATSLFAGRQRQACSRFKLLLTASGVDLTGWRLNSATGVSADGTVIVGYGTDPTGNIQAWIARLTPLPQRTNIVSAVAPNARTTTVGTA